VKSAAEVLVGNLEVERSADNSETFQLSLDDRSDYLSHQIKGAVKGNGCAEFTPQSYVSQPRLERVGGGSEGVLFHRAG
jgi:hypothetical protein